MGGGAIAGGLVGSASDAGGIQGVLEGLLRQERYQEAMACKQHIESIAQLAVQKSKYEAAKEDDDLETAIHLKKVVLPKLREQVQPEDVVQAWSAPSQGFLTLPQIAAKAEAVLGAAEVAPFVTRCCSRELRALAATSLPEAARVQAVAMATLELLLELPAAAQAAHLRHMGELHSEIVARLEAAAEALQAPRPTGADDASHAAVLQGPQVTKLLEALVALRKAGGRLACARAWLSSVFVSSASGGAVVDAAESRAKMCSLVRSSLAAAGRDPEAEAAAEAEEAQALLDGGARYWQVALPVAQRCYLSLLPLASEAWPELPPTVEWEGKALHAPYANAWANCVRDTVPA